MLSSLWAVRIAATMTTFGVASLVYFGFSSGSSPAWERYQATLDDDASFLMWRVPGRRIAWLQLTAVAILSWLALLLQSTSTGLLALLAALLPWPAVLRLRRARVAALERQLGGWLLMLANALKATSSLTDAIASTVPLTSRPFADEVDRLLKEVQLGATLQRATRTMARRIGSSTISAALATIVVASQTGGNLVRTLEKTSAGLRESARLDGMLKAKTAEGRGQVLLLALMPFVLLALIGWLEPSWFDPVFAHSYGHAIAILCSLLWVIAVLWAHRIVRVDL